MGSKHLPKYRGQTLFTNTRRDHSVCDNTLSTRRHSWPPFTSLSVGQEASGIYNPIEDDESSGNNLEYNLSNEFSHIGRHCKWNAKDNKSEHHLISKKLKFNSNVDNEECQDSGQVSPEGIDFIKLCNKTPQRSEILRTQQHSTLTNSTRAKDGHFEDGKDLPLNHHGLAKALRKLRIAGIFQHYYPEGGWGYVIVVCTLFIQVLGQGVQMSMGMLMMFLLTRRPVTSHVTVTDAGWLGALSMCTSLMVSPLIVAICRRKSTRVMAAIGGLVTALGCLFTSFASQLHQVFLSYGAIIGIGVAMTRDPATIMVGQYFKRKREIVEIILVSANGLGIAGMSLFMKVIISLVGWRIGLQVVSGLVVISFIMALFYRSASLYHPQRRAILHLKSQKRKIKIKEKDKKKFQDESPKFMDFTTLKSKTVQIILCSISLGSFGLYAPFFYFTQHASLEGIRGKSLLWLQAYLGIGWALGSCLFGSVAVNSSTECRISKQYLCQASLFMAGISILAFTAVEGYNGYVVFVWIYGISCGGYSYTLKMYIYEKVRARNFARVWSFAQCCMSVPNLVGIPASGYINTHTGSRSGYYFSATFVLLGSLVMVLIDVRRRNLRNLKRSCQNEVESITQDTTANGHHNLLVNQSKDFEHRDSYNDRDLTFPPATLLSRQRSFESIDDPDYLQKPELTVYSQEGIADMEYLMEDLDNITSCDRVENCVVLSEFEQNLTKEIEMPFRFPNHRLSIIKPQTLHTTNSESEDLGNLHVEIHPKALQCEMMRFNLKKSSLKKYSQKSNRNCMSIIEEVSC